MGQSSSTSQPRLDDLIQTPIWSFYHQLKKRLTTQADRGVIETLLISSVVPSYIYDARFEDIIGSALQEPPIELGLTKDEGCLSSPSTSTPTTSPTASNKQELTLLRDLWRGSRRMNAAGEKSLPSLEPFRAEKPEKLYPFPKGKHHWVVSKTKWYGKRSGGAAVFEPRVFEIIMDFLGGDSVVREIPRVEPNWFLLYYDVVMNYGCRRVLNSFVDKHSGILTLRQAVVIPQDLKTCDSGCRYDLVLYAELLPVLKDQLVTLRHTFTHSRTRRSEEGIYIPKKNRRTSDRTSLNVAAYQVHVGSKGGARDIWIMSDRSRKHGSDFTMSDGCRTPCACPGDYIEIPVNLVSDYGHVRWNSILWLTPELETKSCWPEHPDMRETQRDTWVPLPDYKRTTVERVTDESNKFEPFLSGISANAMGTAMPVTRHNYVAQEVGEVSNSIREIGHMMRVYGSTHRIVVSLSKSGLQHDRFLDIVLRKGDNLTVYKISGGRMDF